MKYGLWTQTGKEYYDRTKQRTSVPVTCKCGITRNVDKYTLTSGKSKGCRKCRAITAMNKANIKHGESKTSLYHVWKEMRARCNRPSHDRYCDYGGRGITVCREWESYPCFSSWAKANGYKKGLHLDRMNNDKGYSPINCHFITPQLNGDNTRKTLRITAFNETKSLTQWSKDSRCKTTKENIYNRIYALKWDAEKAISS